MKTNLIYHTTKIRILILTVVIAATGCSRSEQPNAEPVTRFEKLIFTIPVAQLSDTIRSHYPNLIPFFRAFNEEIIRIGPDTVPGYPAQLERFVNDTVIKNTYTDISKLSDRFRPCFQEIDRALDQWRLIPGNKRPEYLVTYLSGFNQSFITLPGILGIGLDNYLGSESLYYQQLGIPMYIRRSMSPANLSADAVRAWIYSELPQPGMQGDFLERMIYEGKVYYLASKMLTSADPESLFHYSKEQLKWCRDHEQAMWEYLAEQKVLFSNERMTIRRYIDEAPFTRDFGNESPGRVGVWIGYQVINSYMKKTGASMEALIKESNAKTILASAKYHP